MKCICDRAALHEALSAVSSVVATRTPKPILECVHLTVSGDELTLMTYDQEVGLRYRVREVEVSDEGAALVDCARLVAIIRESTDETMAFETDDEKLHVRGSDSHFQIVGKDVREFPPVPAMEGEPELVVKVSGLQQTVEKTLFAAARESTRYAINGVLWEGQGKRLTLVATDGRRLSMSSVSLEKSPEDGVRAIVPSKPLVLLSRLHFGADELLGAKFTQNQVIMQTERVTIGSVLVEGNFPKWEDVVPRDNDKEFTLQRDVLLSAVKRAALLANVESKGIAMELEGEEMKLSSRSAEQGEANVRLKVDYKGEKLRIGFNPEFLIDALKVCDEDATVELKDSSRPGLIRSGKDFRCVVMPVNLS